MTTSATRRIPAVLACGLLVALLGGCAGAVAVHAVAPATE